MNRLHHRTVSVVSRMILSMFCIVLVSGCTTTKVNGRVIAGAISHVGVVDNSDERLTKAGIDGIEVSVVPLASADSNSVIARAVSTRGGHFSLKFDSNQWPTDRVWIRASGDQWATARGKVFLPQDGKSILILLERTEAD